MSRRAALIAASQPDGQIPAGYTRLSYLETAPNQDYAIDTGIFPNNNTGYKIIASDFHGGIGDRNFFGCRGGGQRFMLNEYSGSIGYGFNSYKNTHQPYRNINGTTELSLNYLNSRTFEISALNYSESLSSDIVGTIPCSFWLFEENNNNASDYGSSSYIQYRLYEAVITQGTAVIADFVPVLDAQNTPCMYDLVRNRTFYNSQSGEFLYG